MNVLGSFDLTLGPHEGSGPTNDHTDKPRCSGFVKVAGRQAIRVPAGSCKVVSVSGLQSQPDGTPVIVESIKGSLPEDVSICSTLTRAQRGTVAVQVMNSSREDVWLDARLRIGLYQVVDEIENDRVSFRRVSCNEEWVSLTQPIGINHISVSDLRKEFDVGEHCTNEQVEKLEELLRMNAGAFAQYDNDLGYTDMIRHSIRTSAETPVSLPFRRIPPTQYQEVKEHIRMLLGQGVIKESHSAWASPIVLVRKKDKMVVYVCVSTIVS